MLVRWMMVVEAAAPVLTRLKSALTALVVRHPVKEKSVDLMAAGALAVPVRIAIPVTRGLAAPRSVKERNVETTDVGEPAGFVQTPPSPRVKKEFVRPPVSPIASIKNVDTTDVVALVGFALTLATPCVQTGCAVPMRAVVPMAVCWQGR